MLEDRRMLATFTVANLDDAGVGSFREAMLNANSQSGADTIDFNLGLFATPQTLDLVSALPTIVEDLTITGPGHDRLTLHAGNGPDNLPGTGDGFRLFDIDDSNPGNLLTVAVQGLTLTGGDVTGAGGAIRSRENLTISDAAILDNATGPGTLGSSNGPGQNGGNGGGGGFGGGIYSSGGNLTVIGSTISGNSTGSGGNGGDGADGADGSSGGHGGSGGSGGYGGGIFTDGGDLTILSSTISGNSTGAGGLSGIAGDGGDGDLGGDGGNGGNGGYGGNGGGIYSSVGKVTISRSTISGNFTGLGTGGATGGEGGLGPLNGDGVGGDGGDGGYGGNGGGLYNVEGRLEISMSTITGNQTGGGGLGGGGGSTGGLTGNHGTDGEGGGIDSLGNDPVLIDNSIIAANHSLGIAPDLRTGALMLNVDFSLIGNGDGLLISSGTGNQIGTSLAPMNPQLGPLANNGGSTQTHALLTDSPAIDAGDPSLMFDAGEYDQRGAPFVRVEDGNLVAGVFVDLGAYEAQAPPSADFDQDNDVDGTDFLRWQRGFDITSGALPADGNADDDDDVDASDLAVWQATYGTGAPAIQAQRTEPAPPPSPTAATSTSPTLLTDLALATFGNGNSKGPTADATEPEFFSAEIYANAFAEIPTIVARKSASADSLKSTSSADSQIATIDLQLQDELISILF